MKKHNGLSRRTVVGGLVAGAGAAMFTSKSATRRRLRSGRTVR